MIPTWIPGIVRVMGKGSRKKNRAPFRDVRRCPVCLEKRKGDKVAPAGENALFVGDSRRQAQQARSVQNHQKTFVRARALKM